MIAKLLVVHLRHAPLSAPSIASFGSCLLPQLGLTRLSAVECLGLSTV